MIRLRWDHSVNMKRFGHREASTQGECHVNTKPAIRVMRLQAKRNNPRKPILICYVIFLKTGSILHVNMADKICECYSLIYFVQNGKV